MTLEELQNLSKDNSDNLSLEQLNNIGNSQPTSMTNNLSAAIRHNDRGLIGDLALPFSKMIRTAGGIIQGIEGLGQYGIGKLIGKDEFAQQGLKSAGEALNPAPKKMGILGEITPLGYDEQGNKLSTGKTIGQAIGTGAEIASYGIGGGELGMGSKLAEGAVKGAAVGSIGGLGASLQKESESQNDLGKSALNIGEATALGGVLGGALGFGAEWVKDKLPQMAQSLEKSNLRLTPTQKQNLGNKVNEISKYISDNVGIGTPESRYSKITNIYNKTEDILQNFLNKGEASGIVIPKEEIVNSLENLKIYYQMSDVSDLNPAIKQIDQAIERLNIYGDSIPIGRLNTLKRDVFSSAYNKAGDKVLDWVEHDIGGTYKNIIETATNGLNVNGFPVEEFNKKYGIIIAARKLLKIAESKSQTGLIGKLFASLLGAGTGAALGGGIVGGTAGVIIGEEAARKLATPLRSSIGEVSKIAGKIIPSPETVAKIITPSTRERP